jgi:hypothetical protein
LGYIRLIIAPSVQRVDLFGTPSAPPREWQAHLNFGEVGEEDHREIDERVRDLSGVSCRFLGTLPQFLWFPAQQGQYFSHARDLKFRREVDAL